jgi:hypothetical protein
MKKDVEGNKGKVIEGMKSKKKKERRRKGDDGREGYVENMQEKNKNEK